MKHYVYFLKNIINNKIYCGVTNNPKRRKIQHFSKLRTKKHIYRNGKPSKLQNAFNKYGEENFTFQVIYEFANSDEAYFKEKELIEELDLRKKGYNEAVGGKGVNMWLFMTEEEKEEYCKNMKKIISNLHKEGKIRKSNKFGSNNGMFGRTHSEETRKKISQALKGKSMPKKSSENYKRGKNSQAKKLILTFEDGRKELFECKPDLMDYIKENNINVSASTIKNLLKQDRYYKTERAVFRVDYYKGSTTRESIT